MFNNNLELKDGDTLTITSSDATAFDPNGKYQMVRSYRVLSVKDPHPILELIPVGCPVMCRVD